MAIETVSSTSPLLNNVRASDIWSQITAYDKVDSSLPEIVKIKKISKTRSEWHLMLDGIPFSWYQKDRHENRNYVSNFTQLIGDFEHFSGSWKIVKNINNSLKFQFQIHYSIGLPAVEDSRSNVCKVMLQNFTDMLVNWHYKKFVGYATDTRSTLRYPVNDKKEILIGSKTAEVHVVNISRSGIMFSINNNHSKVPSAADADITLGKQRIFGKIYSDPYYSICRIQFSKELSDEEMWSILSMWKLYPDRSLLTVFEVLTSDSNKISSEVMKGL
ncbi:MAG: SRPBCC family protein [Chitinispirillaceae bacterium]|nr:SRPBCC family protein [Chitinispirillaceae bacterium]